MIQMKVFRHTVILAVLLGCSAVWQAAAGPLPDTGQTKVSSRRAGEDASYIINPPSFSKLDVKGNALPAKSRQWTMVRDEVTGLIWEVKTENGSMHDWFHKFTWEDARNDYISRLNRTKFGGFEDWRLPTVYELTTLLNQDKYLPAIDQTFFPFAAAHPYWSETADAEENTKAWWVHFCRGYIHSMDKGNSFYVRAVRGTKLPTAALIDNGDGTVTDITTGLMWQKAAEAKNDWESALSFCETLTLAGYDDWRLPNAREMQSIIDYTRRRPSIDTRYFSTPTEPDPAEPDRYAPNGYWTSTIYASNDDAGWVADFDNGAFFHHRKNNKYGVKAVRGGQNRKQQSIIITSPRQGSIWKHGQDMTIRWDQADLGDAVKITLSYQGGKKETFDTVITERIENKGAYTWRVNGNASANCAIRIAPVNASDEYGIQGLFSIIN
jgi:hypothetical protein